MKSIDYANEKRKPIELWHSKEIKVDLFDGRFKKCQNQQLFLSFIKNNFARFFSQKKGKPIEKNQKKDKKGVTRTWKRITGTAFKLQVNIHLL